MIAAKPIVFGEAEETLSLVLYCTGVRGRHSEQPVTVHLGALSVVASYAGPQMDFQGLDQINIVLPRTLAGIGEVGIHLDVGGFASNTASVTFR